METGGDPPAAADGTPSTGTLPPPRPQQVEWKTAIRCAALVAGIGSLLSLLGMRVDALSLLSFLWILFASLIAVGIYQRRRPAAWMDVRIGARIGVLVGLCLAVGLGIAMAGWGLVARYGLHTMGSFDTTMLAQLQEAAHRSATPIPADMLGFVNSPEFRAGMMLGMFAFVSGCLLMLSAVGGAVAGMLKIRRGPAV